MWDINRSRRRVRNVIIVVQAGSSIVKRSVCISFALQLSRLGADFFW